MTTIKITVDNKKNAQLLVKLLRSMKFVRKIEEDTLATKNTDQFTSLKNILKSIEPDSLFRSIDNPVEWQKNIRDEWETC